ncbi:hypothetical protein HNP40_000896 [Mycobacteroides chelonae]|nr:hypothetical protein [Mycobacteroides chelonae]
MAFSDGLASLAKKIRDTRDSVQTEEATKNAFIMPLISNVLGYERVHHRDGKSYFAILLDNNNRKPIIRLHLNGKSVKFVTTFEGGKDGVRRDIQSVVDIYTVAAEHIRKTIRQYESGGALAAPPLGDEEGGLTPAVE